MGLVDQILESQRAIGRIQGAGIRSTGQAYGSTLANIGQAVGAIPGMIQQRQQQAQRAQMDALEMQEAQARAADRQRGAADVAAIDTALQTGGDDRKAIVKSLIQSGKGHLVGTLQKTWSEADTQDDRRRKASQEADEAKNDYFGALASGVKAFGATPEAFDLMLKHAEEKGYDTSEERALLQQAPEKLTTVLDAIIARSPKFAPKDKPQPQGFTLTPGGVRFDEKGNEIASVPAPDKPASATGFTLSPGQTRYDAEGKPIASIRPTGAGGGGALSASDKKLVDSVIANPSMYAGITPTVKTRIMSALADKGFKFTDANGKPATGIQTKTLGFFNRAKQADEDLKNVEEVIASKGVLGQTWMSIAPNVLQTQEGQSYAQSRRAFTEALLRRDSGAAISAGEFANADKTYFAQPGDSKKTLEQKRRARAGILAGMGFEAGPALGAFYGDDADAMVQGYRTAAQIAAEKAPVKNPFRP